MILRLRPAFLKAPLLAALLGGPVGMSGYLIAINNIGPGYTAIISTFYPAVGTLLAFLFVSFGIIPLRRRKDIGNKGGFRVPFYPVLPVISGLACLGMMAMLSKETWIGAGIWFGLGIILYFSYGYWHSKLNQER